MTKKIKSYTEPLKGKPFLYKLTFWGFSTMLLITALLFLVLSIIPTGSWIVNFGYFLGYFFTLCLFFQFIKQWVMNENEKEGES